MIIVHSKRGRLFCDSLTGTVIRKSDDSDPEICDIVQIDVVDLWLRNPLVDPTEVKLEEVGIWFRTAGRLVYDPPSKTDDIQAAIIASFERLSPTIDCALGGD